ncbi:peptidylprolyl isomerase [Colwellia psychrerythraea]|uniref:peptidylprolyl isomerase n=1 Tax=Colwellia psychrerythraea TaxID=28229 RepID=A0A099K9Q5_COLPS|nr:peptidylprolyl isomerase [Colwellia psychrerythraea]KGJ86797.1 PpiC-type peptidyl-prolyl cis-trans isomerase [Colwellia psychrerythraea]
MKLVNVAVIIACASLGACDMLSSKDLNKEKFEAYLTLKRIPLNDEARYERMKKEYNQRAALVSAIDSTKKLKPLTINAEVEQFRKQLVISRYFEQYLNDAVTDQGLQNFYNQNIENYKSRKIHAAHILFRVNPKMGEVERQALLTSAQDTYSKITSGNDFSKLAKSQSDDKVSGTKGGDLGWIKQGAVSAEFSQKVFNLKAGEVSAPFLTAYGYHIVKVIEEPQEITKSFESVKGDIRYQLRNQSKQAEMARLIKSAE